MKVKEMRELQVEELKSRIDETRKQVVELRFQLAVRKLDSPAKLRTAKKTLSRLLTIQTEKQRVSPAAAGTSPAPKASKARTQPKAALKK